jgi:hypothetical protein
MLLFVIAAKRLATAKTIRRKTSALPLPAAEKAKSLDDQPSAVVERFLLTQE